ncbi:MAG: hypothetical protein ACJ72N_06510 [Labedaea sp.]
MDRRLLHKFALIGGGLVLIGGAIVVLRDPDAGLSSDTPAPAPALPQQTTVRPFADASVIVPRPGERPKAPSRLNIRAGEHRLVAGWGPQHIGEPEPAGAEGYEVRWGEGGRFEHTRYIAQPVIQLDGLRDDVQYTLLVRTVDAFGQRSTAVRGTGTPSAAGDQDPTSYTMVDRFDGDVVPDPARWRLVGIGNCTKASRGEGEDARRMVITGQCGDSDEAVALRSRTPIRLNSAAPGGELGRYVVQTDRPGQSGELMLDLVPGPVDLIGRPPSAAPPAAPPGRAVVDDSLPPGTIRVRISGRPPEAGATTVRVLVGSGTPLLGKQIAVSAAPPPEVGVSVRWTVVLRTDGVYVQRDGLLVGAGDAVPAFTEATALAGLTGGDSSLRAAFDLIGFTGSPTAPPPLVPAPRVDFDRVAADSTTRLQTSGNGQRLARVTGGLLRVTLVPQRKQNPAGQFTVDIGGREIPARTAVPGQPMMDGVRLPIVADVPPDALMVSDNADSIPVVVRSVSNEDGLPTQVLTAELELTGDGSGSVPGERANAALPRGNPALAVPNAALLDAAGTAIPALQEVPRGRLVLEVVADAEAAQRATGEVAGLAGVEVVLDGKQLAGIPTAAEGPGVGGRWRIALNTTGLTPGGHNLQVTAFGVDAVTAFQVAYAPFVIR